MKKRDEWMRGFVTAVASINLSLATRNDQLIVAVVTSNGFTLEDLRASAGDGDFDVIREAFENQKAKK